MAVNGGHAGTKKGPNWGHVSLPLKRKTLAFLSCLPPDIKTTACLLSEISEQSPRRQSNKDCIFGGGRGGGAEGKLYNNTFLLGNS